MLKATIPVVAVLLLVPAPATQVPAAQQLETTAHQPLPPNTSDLWLVPSAADLPSYVTDRTESRAANSLGVKGVGEAGTIASTPAVVNAIVDALRPLGINDVEMPCTPERVWRAIQDARGGEQASAAEQHAARQSDQTQGHSPQGIGTPDPTGGAA